MSTSDFSLIPRKKGSGRPTTKPSVEQLAKDYGELSVKEVAKKYKVKEATIRSWVFKARRGIY